jgi:hypothetical protein
LFSVAQRIQNNLMFSCAFIILVFNILRFCRLTLRQPLISFIHLSIHPLETQKFVTFLRQILKSFSLLLYVSQRLLYVQVNQLKKACYIKVSRRHFVRQSSQTYESLPNHTLSNPHEQQKMSLKHVHLFVVQTNREISARY